MPNPKVEYEVELKRTGDGAAQARKDLESVESAAQKTGRSLTSLAGGFKTAILALAGSAVIRNSIQEFQEAEAATARLNQALKGTGQFAPSVVQQMNELAEAMARVTTFKDDDVKGVIARLLGLGVQPGEMEFLTRAVLDLSAALGKDLSRGITTVAAAMKGDFSAFEQLGFKLKEGAGITEQYNYVMSQFTERGIGGAAQAAAETFTGELDQMNKAVADLEKQFGGFLVQVLQPFIKLTTDASRALDAHIAKQRTLLDLLGKSSTSGTGLVGLLEVIAGNPQTRGKAVANIFSSATSKLVTSALSGGSQPSTNAAATGGGAPPFIETEKMAKDRIRGAQTVVEREIQILLRAEAVREELARRQEQRSDELSLKELENAQRVAQEEQQLKNETVLAELTGFERVRAQAEIDHEGRKQRIREMTFDTEEQYQRLIDLEKARHQAVVRNLNRESTLGGRLRADMQQIGATAQVQFAQGLGGALVDAFEQGNQAFKAFARNFLRTMAQMILQTVILRLVSGAVGGLFRGNPSLGDATGASFSEGFSSTGNVATATRLGSLAPRRLNLADFSASIAPSSLPTFSPAGSGAGAGGGAGGTMVIEVRVSSGSEARIVENAIKGSVAKVTHDMGHNTKLARKVKGLST